MSNLAQQAANMLDMLPEQDQKFAFEFIKKLVLAWDPDFTKVTRTEYDEIIQAEKEMQNGDFISHSDIAW